MTPASPCLGPTLTAGPSRATCCKTPTFPQHAPHPQRPTPHSPILHAGDLPCQLPRHEPRGPAPPITSHIPSLSAAAALLHINTAVPQPTEHMLSAATTASSVSNSPL
ncbi:hypothetical protein B0H17DRAFT_1207251 [Mycena rosella]|uniref:Uncharacterized protein n=1 Tax=Mycena rosella TaxID=1033263 RepID=A0AAD7G856_MYCRO|nr:hypothetical protein B0H17DRAFT_1207251 [Mycena rosella]